MKALKAVGLGLGLSLVLVLSMAQTRIGRGWAGPSVIFALGTQFVEEAANVLAQRNGTNAQLLRVCNTYTSSTNNECLQFDWQVSAGTAQVWTNKGSGGGTYRSLVLKSGNSSTITLGPNDITTFGNSSGNSWNIAAARHLLASTTNAFDIGTSTTVAAPRTIYAGTSVVAPVVNATTAFQLNGVALTFPIVCSNTSASTAITGTATETAFDLNCRIPASTLVAGSTIVADFGGRYTGNNTDTLIFKLKACTVSGCASGTVVTLATTSAVTLTAVTNQYWDVHSQLIAWTVGAAGTIEPLTRGLVATTGLAGTILTAPNTAAITVDTTVDQYITLTAKFSTTSGTNNITLRNFRVALQ